MTLENKSFRLTVDKIQSSNNMWLEEDGPTIMSTHFMAHNNSYLYSTDPGQPNSILGYRCMDTCSGYSGYLFCTAYGDTYSFGVHRINDNGSIQVLSGTRDSYPIGGTLISWTAMAIYPPSGWAFVGSYVYDGMARYDFSSLLTGWTGITKTFLSQTGNNLPSDRVGDAYINGLAIAGDYLYLCPQEATYTGQYRWNVITQQQEMIGVINRRNAGRHGCLSYDSAQDRMFNFISSDGETWLTVNASKSKTDPTNPAQTYCIRINNSPISLGDDVTNFGFINDPTGSNIYVLGGTYRLAKIDITPCFASGTGILLAGGSTPYYRYPPYTDVGSHYFSTPHPDYPTYGIICADRDYYITTYGWIDNERAFPVYPKYGGYGGYTGKLYGFYQKYDMMNYRYSQTPVRITTTGNKKYWVYGGYGLDGDRFTIFGDTTGCILYNESSMQFGPYTLDNSGEIGTVYLSNIGNCLINPSGCSTDIFVSNTNGISWESYDYTSRTTHEFSTNGSSFCLLFNMYGQPDKSPYLVEKFPTEENKFTFSISERSYIHPNSRVTIHRLAGNNP